MMKLFLAWQTYPALRPSQPQRHKNTKRFARLNDVWQSVIAHFATSSEPHVWLTQDAQGHPHWKAYDPVTKQSADYLSEQDMRAWLEERHYFYHRSRRFPA